LEINNAVVSHLDLKELLKSISTSLHKVVRHDLAFVALLDSTGNQLRVHAFDLHSPHQGPRFPEEGITVSLDETPEGAAIRTRRPVFITNRAAMDQFSPDLAEKAAEYGIKSGCAVPLIAHGHALGTVSMVSYREQAFTEADAKLLEQCSTQVSIAVQNSINFETAREAERQMSCERDRKQLLLDINNAIGANLDLHELVENISARLQHGLQHDFIGLALYDEATGKMFARALNTLSEPIMEGLEYDMEGTVTGLSFRTGQPVYI